TWSLPFFGYATSILYSSLLYKITRKFQVRKHAGSDGVHSRTPLEIASRCRTCFHPRMPWDIWLIFLVLGVIVPWRGRMRLRQLLAKPRVEPAERLSLYASTIVFQWFAVAVVGWRAWVHGFGAAELGLIVPEGLRLAVIAVFGAVFLTVLQWFNLRRV